MKKNFSIFAVAVSIIVLTGINLAFAEWSEPLNPDPPTSPAVDTPLNVGSNGQGKLGGLILGMGSGVTYGLLVQNGLVGIGTASPGYKLDVQGGQINASGGLCINGDCKTKWFYGAEPRTSDPASPTDGQMWLRTDL